MTHKSAFIEAIQSKARLTPAQAESVFAVYRRVNALKFTAHKGFYLAHGSFLDRPVILRALALSENWLTT